MIISAFVLLIICCVKVGGIQSIKELYPYALADTTLFSNITCGVPPNDYFSLIRPLNSVDGPPWVGVIGMVTLSIWYFCRSVIENHVRPIRMLIMHIFLVIKLV